LESLTCESPLIGYGVLSTSIFGVMSEARRLARILSFGIASGGGEKEPGVRSQDPGGHGLGNRVARPIESVDCATQGIQFHPSATTVCLSPFAFHFSPTSYHPLPCESTHELLDTASWLLSPSPRSALVYSSDT